MFTVRDGLRPVEFSGEQLSSVSTETERSVRWVELELYWAHPSEKMPAGGYFVHIIGQSVVYHKHESSCNTGVATQMRELPEDAEPCQVCRPPSYSVDLLADASASVRGNSTLVVDLESSRHTLYRSIGPREQSALGIVQQMQRRPSAPAQRLLETAAQKDKHIAAAMAVAETL